MLILDGLQPITSHAIQITSLAFPTDFVWTLCYIIILGNVL